MNALGIQEIKKIISPRFPFLFIDRVVDYDPGKKVIAIKNLSANEDFFQGHFPGAPIFPGAFIAEAMAQAACILFKKSIADITATLFFVTNVKIRFFKPVLPGDRLDISITTIKMTRIGGIFETEASVGENIVARGEMTFACK